jgi:hypothetical protein
VKEIMMGEYKLVVLTRPVEGREDEFNDWYTNQHLDDVLAIPGFTAAQRFRIVGEPVNTPKAWKYYAVYEVEHDAPLSVLDELLARVGGERMPMSEAMDGDLYCVLYEPITPRKTV